MVLVDPYINVCYNELYRFRFLYRYSPLYIHHCSWYKTAIKVKTSIKDFTKIGIYSSVQSVNICSEREFMQCHEHNVFWSLSRPIHYRIFMTNICVLPCKSMSVMNCMKTVHMHWYFLRKRESVHPTPWTQCWTSRSYLYSCLKNQFYYGICMTNICICHGNRCMVNEN